MRETDRSAVCSSRIIVSVGEHTYLHEPCLAPFGAVSFDEDVSLGTVT